MPTAEPFASKTLEFRVIGDPQPKGSAKAFVVGGRARVTNDCAKTKPWANEVHWTAREHVAGAPFEGPVSVDLSFVKPRVGRLGKTRCNVAHDKKPDLDKLVRAVLDALTGVCWVDDAQVAGIVARKRYADPGEAAGVTVRVMAAVKVEG